MQEERENPKISSEREFFPIDHLLASPDCSVLDRRTLEPVGSDHLPVWVVLSLGN
ncbi:MAG: hypothetical protein IPM23_14865 [Candidatus Melainabacteria bacterium]|nr:hypothetical protein [Candidatus Melainabacteria bacterium]